MPITTNVDAQMGTETISEIEMGEGPWMTLTISFILISCSWLKAVRFALRHCEWKVSQIVKTWIVFYKNCTVQYKKVFERLIIKK